MFSFDDSGKIGKNSSAVNRNSISCDNLCHEMLSALIIKSNKSENLTFV